MLLATAALEAFVEMRAFVCANSNTFAGKSLGELAHLLDFSFNFRHEILISTVQYLHRLGVLSLHYKRMLGCYGM